MKKSSSIIWLLLILVVIGGGCYYFSTKNVFVGCIADAKICPDGSGVGRVGPKCEFAPCPNSTNNGGGNNGGSGTSNGNSDLMKQKITIGAVTITPLEIVEDSRCPTDVNCIWAGTVRLRARLDAKQSGSDTISNEVVLNLGTPTAFAGNNIELQEVNPAKNSKTTVLPRDYRFVFSVTKI